MWKVNCLIFLEAINVVVGLFEDGVKQGRLLQVRVFFNVYFCGFFKYYLTAFNSTSLQIKCTSLLSSKFYTLHKFITSLTTTAYKFSLIEFFILINTFKQQTK